MHTTREEQNLRQISKSVELKDASWKNHHTSQQIPNQIPPIAFSTAVSTVRTNPNFESISKLHQVQQLQPVSYKPNDSYISVAQSSQQKGSVLEKTSVCSPYETLIRTFYRSRLEETTHGGIKSALHPNLIILQIPW